jgi:hypothetical protein
MPLLMPPASRSDECNPGSKPKYKHCCLRLEQGHAELQDPLQHSHLFQDENLALLNAAIDIFDLRRGRIVLRVKIRWAQVKSFFTEPADVCLEERTFRTRNAKAPANQSVFES